MARLNITAKIWLSVGIFVLGYVLSTVLAQVQGLRTERTLGNTSSALFPAAQQSQDAEAAFQRTVKAFSDAVLVQDASALENAAAEGRAAVGNLKAIAATQGLPAGRAAEAGRLADGLQRLVSDAGATYGAVLAHTGALSGDDQARMRELASQTDTLKAGLTKLKEQVSGELRAELNNVQSQSRQQRWIGLVVFGSTLALAAILVNLTIRRGITGPIRRVIVGVQEAADQAAQASARMAESGQTVARDAQEQAACLEETSASLEQIAATTRENAALAGQADDQMQAVAKTAERAGQAMNDLTQSMDDIAKSARQVAVVLKSIDEIAFHTNILALNAAVEAARAGASGAGFSVVADEVRSLAQRAAEAAQRSADIIEKTITDVNRGVSLVTAAHGAFGEVAATIVNSGKAVTQIAASSNEQAQGIRQINEAMTRMQSVTQNNTANAQQTADAAFDMSTQVDTTRRHLDELVTVVGLNATAAATRWPQTELPPTGAAEAA